MTKKYRPEGWEKIRDTAIRNHSYGWEGVDPEPLCEEIADALLEALRKQVQDIDGAISQTIDWVSGKDGRWVFIADDTPDTEDTSNPDP